MSRTIKERKEIVLLWEQIGATNRSVAESFNSTHEGMSKSHTTVGRLLRSLDAAERNERFGRIQCQRGKESSSRGKKRVFLC